MNSADQPFDQLAGMPQPTTTPDPAFARQLRSRIETELAPSITLPARKAPPMNEPALQIVTPYITVHDGAAALDWYVVAFGAVETVRYVGDDGRLGHAEFVMHGANVMLSDAYPEMGVVAANSYEGSSCALVVSVADCDAAHGLAVEHGATSMMEPTDQPHGARTATLIDPFGHRWMLSQQITTPTNAEVNDKYDDFEVISKDDGDIA